MPLNAAAEAARLSVAPKIDGVDLGRVSMGCGTSCAACVHVLIAGYRATSRFLRSVFFEAANISSQISSAEMSAKCVASVGISGLRQDPSS